MSLFTDLSNSVKIVSRFDRSTSLELDFQDSKKLNNIFISEKFETGILDVLETVNSSTSNQRVRVLSGSPGLGKSTFALVLLNLLEKSNPKALREMASAARTPDKKRLNAEVDDFLSNKSKKKLLAVFLNGYMGDIERAFLDKLQEAFARIGTAEEFDQLLMASQDSTEIIDSWKQKYPSVYKRFLESLADQQIDQKKFLAELRAGHSRANKTFGKLYAEITGGASAKTSSDSVIDIYKKANKLLSAKGYGGIFVVYDEFGKYLEQGVHSPSKLNIQFLQDFAEYCDRSGANQCHLLLITHMSVSQYATKLPVAIQKEWAKIEGRFQESSFYDRSANYYKLIARVFDTDLKNSNKALYKRAKSFYEQSLANLTKSAGLDGFAEDISLDHLIECYPLHPVTLAYLPLLSQRIAQNERTLYTFLTRKEVNSLPSFLERGHTDDLPILMPSHLYDYFETSIEKDTGVGGSHRIALIMDGALKSIDANQTIEREILCLLALSEVLRNNRFAPCDDKFISACLGSSFSEKDINVAKKNLLNRKLIVHNRVANRYELTQGSSIDIDEELEKLRAVKLSSKDMVQLMAQFLPQDYLIPNRYNLKNCITRFLRRELLSVEELKAGKYDTNPNYEQEDGIIYVVVPFDRDELNDARSIAADLRHDLVFFVIPENFVECRRDIEELKAINALYNNKEIMSAGQLVRKELDRHHKQTLAAILAILRPIVGNAELDVEILYPKTDVKLTVRSYPELLRKISDVLETEYCDYPVFNSEHIVKQKPSSNITIARRLLIDALQKNPDAEWFGLDGDGPEKAIAKALKTAIGSLNWDDSTKRFVISDKSPVKPLFDQYKHLISTSADGSFYKDIVATFIAPPFGIRKAVVPLYVSIFDAAMEHQVNHYFAGEYVANPDGEHYELLSKNPRDAKIQMTELSAGHLQYIGRLLAAFDVGSEGTINAAILSILTWRRSVPDYVKNGDAVSTETLKFLIAIDSSREPDRMLFNSIPAALGFNPITKESGKSDITALITAISDAKTEASEAYKKLLYRTREHLETMAHRLNETLLNSSLRINPSDNLAAVFKQIIGALPEKAQSFKFRSETRQFIERVRSFDPDLQKQYFIETIGDVTTGKSPRSWDSRCESLFEFTLIRIKDELKEVCDTFASTAIAATQAKKASPSTPAEKRLTLNPRQSKVKSEIEQKLSGLSIAEQKMLLTELVQSLN